MVLDNHNVVLMGLLEKTGDAFHKGDLAEMKVAMRWVRTRVTRRYPACCIMTDRLLRLVIGCLPLKRTCCTQLREYFLRIKRKASAAIPSESRFKNTKISQIKENRRWTRISRGVLTANLRVQLSQFGIVVTHSWG